MDVKFLIIRPKKNPVSRLIIKYHHESEGHQMGVNYTINHLREKYLVIHVHEQVFSSELAAGCIVRGIHRLKLFRGQYSEFIGFSCVRLI